MQAIWKILLYAIIGYIAFSLIVFIYQRKLLYLPYKIQLSDDQVYTEGLSYWPSRENYRGFANQVERSESKGTVILFHGNAGMAFHRSFYAKALKMQNMQVILAEYPGYGNRNGRPSEKVLVNDALETIRLVHQEYGEPIFLWGESLGCGVVAGAVSKTEINVKGVVLLLPWDTLSNLAQTHYPYLPARWLVLDKYNNIENLMEFDGNVAVLLAENDEVVPIQHGKKLYDSITEKKELWLFEEARHNDIPIGSELSWWKEVVLFITDEK